MSKSVILVSNHDIWTLKFGLETLIFQVKSIKNDPENPEISIKKMARSPDIKQKIVPNKK